MPHDAPFLMPVALIVAIYAARYVGFAGAAYLLCNPKRSWVWGRVHLPTPTSYPVGAHVRRELRQSALTIGVFGLVNLVLIGLGWIHSSRMYWVLNQYPLWWLVLSVPIMLLLHDSLFYWLHRAMHTRWLFRYTHREHHVSVYPTAFAAYSFSIPEAFAEALIVVAILFLIPVHPLALLVFQTLSTAFNVYGHCGREFYPRGAESHALWRWMNSSTLHALHHRRGHGNYSLYFTFWDRLAGTLEPATADQGREPVSKAP